MTYDDPMRVDPGRRLFTRRMMLLGAGQAALFTGLAARMFYLQVVKYDHYSTLAEDNRINARLLIPLRGRILDRNGVPLAINRQDFRIVLVPESVTDVPGTLKNLGHIVKLDQGVRDRVMEDVRRTPGFTPITVIDDLTWEQFARININIPDLPGVYPEVGYKRYYPWRGLAAHAVGYVGAVSPDDIVSDEPSAGADRGVDPLLRLPDFRIGRRGIEKGVDLTLRGSAGVSRVEVNAYGRVIREVDREPGQPGRDMVLTLDMDTQAYAARLLEGKNAAAVILDVRTGDVIALVSTPSYDPNEFRDGLSPENWDRLVNDPGKPLLDRAIAGQYPPGSTFKLIVALAALENGAVDPAFTVTCRGRYRFGNRDFHCWKRQGHGTLGLVGAIMHSCDIYFYKLVQKVGVEAVADMAHRMGLGERFDLELAGEKGGLIPTPAWKENTRHERWYQGETLVMGIGQGYVLTTPMQLAVMTARLAHGNLAITPRLVRDDVTGAPETPVVPLGVSENALNSVREGMIAVSNLPGGTAYGSRLKIPGLALAGKTGTSQVRRITADERRTGVLKNEELDWEQRDHALFVAYAPVDDPRYALAVVVEHGGSGSRVAAPLARDMMTHVLKRDPVVLAPYRQGA